MKAKKMVIGWREWASLPDMDIPAIKVKVDTGALTSALHAFNIKTSRQGGKEYVRFSVHPLQKSSALVQTYTAPVIDERTVKSSSGHKEQRITIRTPIRIGKQQWEIDITLTNRKSLNYRMLLGRSAMSKLTIDPALSFCHGKISRKELANLYR